MIKRYGVGVSEIDGAYVVVDLRWMCNVSTRSFDRELANSVADELNRRADAPTEGKEESEDESAPARTPKDRAAN